MKKLLVILLLLPSLAQASTWYASSSTANMSAITWYPTSTGSCAGSGTPLSWNSQVAGDTFYANGCTNITVDVDPKGTGGSAGTVNMTTAAGSGTTGGTFIITSGTVTVTANITAGTTIGLNISGDTVTILGNISAGSSTSAHGAVFSASDNVTVGANGSPVTISGASNGNDQAGVSDGSLGTKTIYANLTAGTGNFAKAYVAGASSGAVTINGNITGGAGAGSSAYALSHSGNTSVTVNGDVTGGGAASNHGVYNTSSTGVTTINGKCKGGSVTTVTGCYGSPGKIIVTGSIENTTTSTGTWGKVAWQPSDAAKSIKLDGSGTVIYASAGLASNSGGTAITAANTAAKVSSDTYFIKKDTGVLTQGSASGSAASGGGWGF